MRQIAIRGLVSRKLRGFITTLAVFLGVSFIAGAFVLTDTINASFDDIFNESLKGTDVVISPRDTNNNNNENGPPPAFSAGLLPKTRAVPGVEAAAGAIFSLGRFVDRKGDAVGNEFAPNFISSHLSKRFETLTYVEGHPPRNASEASIDTQTADTGKLKVGGTLRIAGEKQVKAYRIVGETKLGETSFGGAGIAQLTLPEAQRIADKRGEFDQISVAAAKGVDSQALVDRIRRVLPITVQVETAKQSADRQSKEIADQLSFLKILLLIMGFIALLVGSFLIFNTFSITVAQRIRELGMLRTLGASKRQVLGSMVLEATLLGGVGSLLGIPGGIAAAAGINALFKSFGIDLPNTGIVVEPRTIIVALLVGMIVTLLSALAPALRATRVSPMAALREAELPEGRGRGKIFLAATIILLVAGFGMTLVGLFGGASSGAAAGLIGGGAVVTLFGVSLFSPRLVRPLASVAGWPIERLRGLTGRIARENAVRKPGRTAVTAAALMIGVGVVVFISVFAAGFSDSIAKAVDENFQGDIVLQNTDGFSPIPAASAQAAARVPGVQTASSLSISAGTLRKPKKQGLNVSAVDPRTVSQVLTLEWKKGSPDTLSSLGLHDAVLADSFAKSRKLGLGDQIVIRTPTEKTARFTVRGTFKSNAGLLNNVVVSQQALRSEFGVKSPTNTFIKLEPGANAAAVQKAIERPLTRAFPTVDVLNQKQLKDKQKSQINQLVGLLYALLAMAVIVSLLGIVTTLALSIHERTRELGMLRAVGMSRRQVRRMIRYEAVITSEIGAVLGIVLGVVFATLISRPLADEGFTLAYPVGTLVFLLILAALAGVVAAILPARRAAKLNVLEALAYE
jgi:putative ABC transport system permease protein